MGFAYPLSRSPLPLRFADGGVGITLPNRMVFPAWQLNYAEADGRVSPQLFRFYTGLAAGGCGLIMTGCAVVSADTLAFDRVMRIDDDRYVPGLQALFAAIRSLGAVPGIQLIHYGRQSIRAAGDGPLLAPTAIPCPVMSRLTPAYEVREMSRSDIDAVRRGFVSAAGRAAAAGAMVIEFHAAHGYLLNGFLSPYSNRRRDEYGGSPENRVRLVTEILADARDLIGDRAVLGLRVSADEFVSGGLTATDFAGMVPRLEKAGMTLLHVSAGVYESMERIVPPARLGPLPHVHLAAQLKSYGTVPTCAVGSIRTMGEAEEILGAGHADLCAVGRGQVADPSFAAKSFSGREREIRACTQCGHCLYWTNGTPRMHCPLHTDA